MEETSGPPRLEYELAADWVRARVEDGTLRPGQMAPAAAALSRVLGYSRSTCVRGLRSLVAEGALTRGTGSNTRFRVPDAGASPAQRALAEAENALSAGLATRRRAHRMQQQDLAGLLAVSVATVGHAETGRLWHGRGFWERADVALGAGGDLLALHGAYLEARRQASDEAPGVFGAELTCREREVAVLFAQGVTYWDIGRKLGISWGAVAGCMGRVQVKAGTGAGRGRDSRERLAAWLQRQDAEASVPAEPTPAQAGSGQ